MSIDVRTFDPRDDADEWDRYVDRAADANPFYRADALELQAEETATTLHMLAGFKGQEPIGLFPVFEYRKGPIAGVFSPAPYSWVCYLGPTLLNRGKLKQRKADRRNRRFVEACLERIESELSPLYSKFETGEYEDVRPFSWNGFAVRPRYTYVVDLEGTEEELLNRFSSDARSNVRNAADESYVIEEGDGDDVEAIVEQVRDRYHSQDRPFQLRPEFARALYEAVPDGEIRPYVCRADGERLGGILVLETETTRYRWQGGVKPDGDVDLSINDVLDWHVMRDGLRAGLEEYDLVGAGVPAINRYKAKFNPRLETRYSLTAGAFGLDTLIDRYRKFR